MAAASSLRAWGEGEARSKGGPLLKPRLAPTFPSVHIPRSSGTISVPFPGRGRAEAASPPHRDPVPSLSLKTVSRARCHLLLPPPPLTWSTLCPAHTCVPGSGLCVCLSTSETVAAPEPVAAHTCHRVALSPSHFARPRLPPSHQWKVHSSSQS